MRIIKSQKYQYLFSGYKYEKMILQKNLILGEIIQDVNIIVLLGTSH
jgi:hypothetical protein